MCACRECFHALTVYRTCKTPYVGVACRVAKPKGSCWNLLIQSQFTLVQLARPRYQATLDRNKSCRPAVQERSPTTEFSQAPRLLLKYCLQSHTIFAPSRLLALTLSKLQRVFVAPTQDTKKKLSSQPFKNPEKSRKVIAASVFLALSHTFPKTHFRCQVTSWLLGALV